MAKNPFSGSIDVSSLVQILQDVTNGTKSVASAEEELQKAYKKTVAEVKKLEKAQKELNDTRNINAQLSELKNSLNQIQDALKKVGTNSTGTTKGFKSMDDALKSINVSLDGFKEKSSNITSAGNKVTQYTNGMNQLVTVTQKGSGATATYSARVKTLNAQVQQSTKHIKNAAFATENWSYNWAKAMQSFLTYNTVTQLFNTIMNGVRDMVSQVKELDDALVELQKVTDLEGESLENFIDDAYAAGQTVAKTGTEMIEAATAFAKAGFKDNALQLGTVAAMYTNIADEAIDASDAADMIIAQMKAFNIEANDAIHIIDAINEVSNNFAVSSADISRNLGKASAVMANAGNSMEQYIGLMTAATEVTRNASKAANGLKTLTLRLQGMNDEGEKDLEVQAQMEALFQKLGVSVYKANGELKNTYEILETLAPVYENLSNAEKAYVTETIAGKYQAQNAAAILNNWGTAVDATATAMDSAGSAAKENEKVLDSIQGHLQRLDSAWEQLSKNLFNSEFLKFIVDLGSAFLQLANSGLGQATIKIGAFVIFFKMLPGLIALIHSKLVLLTNSFVRNTTAVVANSKATSNLNKDAKLYIIKLLAEKGAIDKTTGSIKTETLQKIKAKLASEGLSQAEQTEILKTITLTATHTAAAKAVGVFKMAIHGLTAAIAANPIGAAITAIVALCSGLKYLSESAQRAQEKYEKLQEEFEESKKKLEDTNEELKKTKDRIEELKTKGKLTFTEKAELDKLEKANLKLETQAKLYERIAEAKEKAAKKAANEAYNKEYDDEFSYKQITNSGELKDMEWYDYINPKHIYDFFSKNTANYGYDTNIITEAVNLYSDLNEKRKEGIKLTKDEQTQYENLEISLAKELEDLEERIPNLTGKTKKEAQELRDYIVRFVYPEIFKQEQANTFFGVDPDDKNAQKIKEKFKDIQEQMDILYQKGELTSKKIWELRGSGQGKGGKDAWNDLDKYMRESGLDNEAIITYYDTIYKKEEEVVEGEKDIWKAAAEERKKWGLESDIDKMFTSIANGEEQANLSHWQAYYEELKKLADQGLLTADAMEVLDEKFGFLSSIELDDDLRDIAGVLDYFSKDAQDTLTDYSTNLDNISQKYQYLTSAVDEFNESGYLTSETLANIINSGLEGYLSFENGQLIANTNELYNSAEASRAYASQQLAAAMTSDMLYIAIGEEEKVSGLAATAIENLGNSSETAGAQAENATGKFIGFAEAVDQANKALSGKEVTEDIQNKINAVQKAYKPYFDLLSKPIQIEKHKYTGGGSGSKSGSSGSSKEWWEQELDNLKDQFNNSEITVDQYINSLTNLLGKVQQGTDAWKKINQELYKQKLDKIKDDYDSGRISLNQYIISLQNLQKEYKQGTKAWNELATAIKKAKLDQLKEQQNDLKSALSAVNNVLDKQINEYKDLKEAADDRYDDELDKLNDLRDSLGDNNDDYERAQKAVVDFLNEQLDAINEQKDTVENYYDDVINAIEKMNEDTKESIELAEAYEALMNAMTQKTKKVYKEGLGWVWTTDAEAIKEAKKTYDDLINSATTKEIEEQKDKTVKSLEEQIESLQNYIDSWDKVFDKFDNEKNRNLADILLGENWSEMVSNLDPQIVDDFSDAYYELQKNLEETEKQIEELNKQKEEEDEYWDKLIKDLQDYKGEWADVASVYEEAQNALKARQIMGANWEKEILDRRLDVLENFKNKYNAILAEIDKVDNMSTDQASGYTALRLPGYANGGEVDYTGLAVLHGTPNKPEYVLNNSQMRNLLGNLTKPRTTSIINNKNGAVVNNYNFGDIELPNVTNAQQFANELKSMLNITKNQ